MPERVSPAHELERTFPYFWELSPNAPLRLLAGFIKVAHTQGMPMTFYHDALGFISTTTTHTTLQNLAGAIKDEEGNVSYSPLALLESVKVGRENTYYLTKRGEEVWRIMTSSTP